MVVVYMRCLMVVSLPASGVQKVCLLQSSALGAPISNFGCEVQCCLVVLVVNIITHGGMQGDRLVSLAWLHCGGCCC